MIMKRVIATEEMAIFRHNRNWKDANNSFQEFATNAASKANQGLRTKIQDKEGIPLTNKDSSLLESNLRMEEPTHYNIQKESPLHLVLKFRGEIQIFIKTLTGKCSN